MSILQTLLGLWPALVAGAIGAMVPSAPLKLKPTNGEEADDAAARATTKLRVGLAVIAALTALAVQKVVAGPEIAAEGAAPPTEWKHLLNVLIGLPLLGAFAVLFMPRQMLSLLRGFTLAVLGVGFVASLWLLAGPMPAGWHFQYIREWIPSIGVRYHVAADGISVWLLLLTTFITPIAAYASFGSIKTRIKELCFAFLLLQGAMIGAFVALDLFLFYVFWELMLVPMYIMIGIWGGADKIKAAIKFFVYTMAGSVLMLGAMVYLVLVHEKLTGHMSWDLLALSRVVLAGAPPNAPLWQVITSAQGLCFLAFSLAFFIKVPMWPVHTWLPDAHVQAPTGGSVILAAVMLKLGTYAYMRFSMGLFPGPASTLSANLAGIAILGGILYGALVAWKQKDIKRLVAYSSVAHLGYVMLGLFAATPSGMQGAVLQMVNHGISTGALFLLVGVVYDRRHTREVSEYGGIAKVMPIYATLFLIVTFSSIGVPGTNGFIGEFLIITGTFMSERLANFSGIHTVGAAAGVILAAVYMLSVVQKVFFGPLSNPKNKHLPDLTARESLALAPLILMIFVIGFAPSLFLDPMKPSIEAFHSQYRTVSGQAVLYADEHAAKMLPTDIFSPAFLKGAPVFGNKDDAAEGGAEANLGGGAK